VRQLLECVISSVPDPSISKQNPDPLVRGMDGVDPDPDPHQNVMDPEHWFKDVALF
jgi:hypothetical protein